MRCLLASLSLGVVFLAGCETPEPRLNAPPHGTSTETSDMRKMYDHMTDNALLADMSVSDIHFLPARAQLNALGVERVAKLAILIELYGGTVRFSTDVEDEALVKARETQILDRLAEAGIDTGSPVLVRDMPASSGMNAGEALLIRANEATYQPKKGGGGAASGANSNVDMTGKSR